MKDKRIGKFIIYREEIEEYPQNVQLVMNECIIIRAEYMFDRDCIEYEAISSQFQPVPEGAYAPEYKITIQPETYGVDESIGNYHVPSRAIFTKKF